jgi:hypothetical protein
MRFFERLFGSRDADEDEPADAVESGDPWEHHPAAVAEARDTGEVRITQSESEFYEGFVDRRDDAAATGGGGGGMFPVLPESTPGELGGQFEGDSTAPDR